VIGIRAEASAATGAISVVSECLGAAASVVLGHAEDSVLLRNGQVLAVHLVPVGVMGVMGVAVAKQGIRNADAEQGAKGTMPEPVPGKSDLNETILIS
jgi:hypothetical protein